MATAAPVVNVIADKAILFFPRITAALVFVSFVAVFSLSVNTRLAILTGSYQGFTKDLLAKKQLLLTVLDERDRRYLKRSARVTMFDMANQKVHIRLVQGSLTGVLIAVAFWALATICAALSAAAETFIYPAVIFLWLGFLTFLPVICCSLYDIFRSFRVLRQEANAVTEFKHYVMEDIGLAPER